MAKKLVHLVTLIDKNKKPLVEKLNAEYQLLDKPALFNGETKEYFPLEGSGERNVVENRLVQQRAKVVLERARSAIGELMDMVYQLDVGNQKAVANIEIDGVVIKKDVPVTFLLNLAARLTEIKTVISKLPTPDPAVEWVYDEQLGLLRNVTVTTQVKTAKVPQVLIKYEATDKHPAQTEVYNKDIPVGEWKRRELTGAIAMPLVREMLERIDKLIKAVEDARNNANLSVEVTADTISGDLFRYVFEPVMRS